MPNWCSNHMTVHGKPDAIAKFCAVLDRVKDGCLFTAFHPVPPELHGVIATIKVSKRGRHRYYRRVDGKDVFLKAAEVKILQSRYVVADEYSWLLRCWGVRSDLDVDSLDITRQPDHLDFVFNTAWSPPIAWLRKVAADYPELGFVLAYAESGNCFAGESVAEAGVLEEVIDYSGNLWRDLTPEEEADGVELDYETPEDIHPDIRELFERHPQLSC